LVMYVLNEVEWVSVREEPLLILNQDECSSEVETSFLGRGGHVHVKRVEVGLMSEVSYHNRHITAGLEHSATLAEDLSQLSQISVVVPFVAQVRWTYGVPG